MGVEQTGENNVNGILYGIGVGPGDPELLTLKAHRLLTQAKVVAYPAPDDGASFARSIVADFIPADIVEIPIVIPMRVSRFPAKEVYDASAVEIAGHLNSGEDVVVLCEGDPFFYGSFMYLYERLVGDHAIEIVPGVSSLMATAAALGRPLAARNDVLSVIPAPLDDDALGSQLEGADAAAIIKVGSHLPRVKAVLDRMGLLENSLYIERATLENQITMPLVDIGEDAAPYFSMILVYKGTEKWMHTVSTDGAKS